MASLRRIPEPMGQILVDGHNVKEFSLSRYRSNISVISQDPVLFSGSFRFNLDPANEFEDTEIWNALEDVQLRSLW